MDMPGLESKNESKRFSASPRQMVHNPLKGVHPSPNGDREAEVSPRLNSSFDRESNGSKDRRHSSRSDQHSVSGDEESHSSRRGSQNGGGSVKDQEERNSSTPKRPREEDDQEDLEEEEHDIKRPAKVSYKREKIIDH